MLFALLMELDGLEDKKQFVALYGRMRHKMYRVALWLLHDPEAAQDAVQESFLKVTKNFSKISGFSPREMDAYVVTIVENTAKDMLRQADRHPTQPLDETWDPPAPETTESLAAKDRLVELILSLPEKYRRVLLLRFVEEETYQTIARRLGLTEDQVDSRIREGRRQLMEKMREEGYEL